jgi:hypothetical protein
MPHKQKAVQAAQTGRHYLVVLPLMLHYLVVFQVLAIFSVRVGYLVIKINRAREAYLIKKATQQSYFQINRLIKIQSLVKVLKKIKIKVK